MKKILVIEDNLEVRENLCEILELSSYEVASAENGIKGIQKVKSFNPDLILCDVMMPELDGFGVLKILNSSPDLNHIPLIFLTAKGEKEDIRKGMGLGADDYITKPFDDVELLEAIEIRLKKSAHIKSLIQEEKPDIKTFFSEAKANKEFEKISDDKEERNFQIKDQIYKEGENPRWLYYVVEGQVKIYQVNEYGKELTVTLLNPGEFFGYFSLINNNAYTNNASCTQQTKLRLIPREDFFQLLYNDRDFAAHFIKLISNRTKETEKQLIEMAYASVRKKIANALIAFAKKTLGEKTNNNVTIIVSRDDLAAMAGTAKETLIRTLSDFKSEGLIESNSKSLIIPDIEKLERIIA